MTAYSWRDFGREAEFIVASYLKLKGWNLVFSPSSRGAADIVASKDRNTWCIQVKASTKSSHIRSEEIRRLRSYSYSINGIPIFASVQPWKNTWKQGKSIGKYMIFLYSLDDWQLIRA